MDQAAFDEHVRRLWAQCGELLIVKGNDYAGSKDRLANFKRNAAAVGLDPMQVWSVYFMKHIDAIMTYVRDGAVKSEAIESRFQDAINYLILGSALVSEKTEQDKYSIIHDPSISLAGVDFRSDARTPDTLARELIGDVDPYPPGYDEQHIGSDNSGEF